MSRWNALLRWFTTLARVSLVASPSQPLPLRRLRASPSVHPYPQLLLPNRM